VVTGWATSIRTGPADESAQQPRFVVASVSRPELFHQLPRVEADGTLTFEPQPNAVGSAEVQLELRDDGGTANGGLDRSPPTTFLITVIKPYPWHNTLRALDVGGSNSDEPDGEVAPGDALRIINFINAYGAGPLPGGAPAGPPYLDTVNSRGEYVGDNHVAPGDALAVINFINVNGMGLPGPAGEGEHVRSSPAAVEAAAMLGQPATAESDLIALLAADLAQPWKRRRG
jgi:hypothetical protein